MMAYTMRYQQELRDPKEYFRDIKKTEIDEDSLDLAKQLIKRKAATFDPSKFVDGYEIALKELVQAKVDHAPIPKDEAPALARGKVVSLMDALRKSVASVSPEEAEEREQAAPKKKPAQKGLSLVASSKKPAPAAKAVKPPKRKSA